jgi:16S rRNA (cytidine1402-2'-O)-methyltransferase
VSHPTADPAPDPPRAGDGVVVVVGTPIGNLGDLTPRAVETLAAADVVACEDTRRTGRLLAHAGVRAARLVVMNEHTEAAATAELLDELDRGHLVAVVTDAGMPGISDPGERLVRAAARAGHEVRVVPGPSAAIAGLVVSGLPAGRFVFEGFLPRRGGARTERLAALADELRTIVCFESPHRIARTVADLAEVLGAERPVAIARELTKLHETVFRGTLGQARDWADTGPKGELVVVIEGAPPPGEVPDVVLEVALDAALAAGASRRDAAAEVAAAHGVSRRRVYDLAVAR